MTTPREGPPQVLALSTRSPVPELGPGEALVAVMASSINYNTVLGRRSSSLVSTFGFLEGTDAPTIWHKRHDLPYHIMWIRPRRRGSCTGPRQRLESR